MIEVLLVHPGGPFWSKKNLGAWTFPQDEWAPGDDLLACARRESEEETGFAPAGPYIPLTAIKQPGGKVAHAWVCRGDRDPETLRSNTFTMEWSARSGRRREFAEIDRAAWYDLDDARRRILRSPVPVLDELEHIVSRGGAMS